MDQWARLRAEAEMLEREDNNPESLVNRLRDFENEPNEYEITLIPPQQPPMPPQQPQVSPQQPTILTQQPQASPQQPTVSI